MVNELGKERELVVARNEKAPGRAMAVAPAAAVGHLDPSVEVPLEARLLAVLE